MADLTFESVLQLARQLPVEEQNTLGHLLLLKTKSESLTRERILAEFERRKAAGAFDNVESLRNKFAGEGNDISEEELTATLHKISTEWEAELDEFFGDED